MRLLVTCVRKIWVYAGRTAHQQRLRSHSADNLDNFAALFKTAFRLSPYWQRALESRRVLSLHKLICIRMYSRKTLPKPWWPRILKVLEKVPVTETFRYACVTLISLLLWLLLWLWLFSSLITCRRAWKLIWRKNYLSSSRKVFNYKITANNVGKKKWKQYWEISVRIIVEWSTADGRPTVDWLIGAGCSTHLPGRVPNDLLVFGLWNQGMPYDSDMKEGFRKKIY